MTAPLINDLRANVERAIRETAAQQGLSAARIESILTLYRRDGTIARAAESVRTFLTEVLRDRIDVTSACVVDHGVSRTERVRRTERVTRKAG